MLAIAFKLSLRGQKQTFCVHSPVKTFIWAPTRLSFDLRDHIPRTEFFVTRSKTATREVASLKIMVQQTNNEYQNHCSKAQKHLSS